MSENHIYCCHKVYTKSLHWQFGDSTSRCQQNTCN